MYDFILQTIFLLSFGTLIYLVARAVPRVTETAEPEVRREDYFERLIKKLPIEKADAVTSMLLEKLLRKVKVTILKLDNFLTKHLKNLKPDNTSDSFERPNIFELDKKEKVNNTEEE